jgi:arginyl-tRNA synthetase
LDVCRIFNQFYHNCRILGQEAGLESSRLKLVEFTEKVLIKGLQVLNMECPDEM